MASDEQTPLIGDETRNGLGSCRRIGSENGTADGDVKGTATTTLAQRLRNAFNAEHRVLLAAFLVTLCFTYTQVPILYAVRIMVCDDFYQAHPPFHGPGDRCSRNEIAAGTATQYSLLGISTSFCGTLNLFLTGWMVKRFGPRLTLMVQTVVPALRVATQILGLNAGGQTGIVIFQTTQLITIFGGPAGYVLVTNIIIGEIVEPGRRTSVFGRLQGCTMIGQSIAYLAGGMIGSSFGIQRPFDVALLSFLVSTVYVWATVPYIPPESMSGAKKPPPPPPSDKGAGCSCGPSLSSLVAPLRVLAPQKLRLRSGPLRNHYGVLFLCSGVFLGMLATGYAPILIQMYASAVFDFDQGDNGWLMSGFALVRGIFLIVVFPQVIALGRRWFRARAARRKEGGNDDNSRERCSTDDQNGEVAVGGSDSALPSPPPAEPAPAVDKTHHYYCAFDLFFLRWSLVLDGALTTLSAYATRKWHVYLAAVLLPLGSGSAPAAKGVITEMCPASQRADALNALTLVENVARLSTRGLFGFVFAALADRGVAYLTFFCNAAIALLAMGVLLFSHFPPRGSVLVEEEALEGSGDQEGRRE